MTVAQATADERHGSAEQDVQIGNDLVFLPHGFVGSIGLLVVPSTKRLIKLGSYTSLDNFLWAYHRGIDLAGEMGAERHNMLSLTAVADKAETLRALRKVFPNRFVREEIEKRLAELPIVLADVDLYFAIPILRAVEEAGYCRLEIR